MAPNNQHPWLDLQVVDANGQGIGEVEDLYFDDANEQPEWALVRTEMAATGFVLVPLVATKVILGELELPYRKEVVDSAPPVDPDGELTTDEVRRLAQHYALNQDDALSEVVSPPGDAELPNHDARSDSSDDAMTRSEEELRVDRVRRPSERVRLRKYVVTEEKTLTVPVRREEVRLERVPASDPPGGESPSPQDAGDDDDGAELVLSEEEVVVEKRVVPKERVRLEKHAVTEEKQVQDTVRREQIEVENDTPSEGETPEEERTTMKGEQ